MTTSIIIPVFNQCSYTAACLETLWKTTNTQEVEVVVIDNGSTDETGEYLKAQAPHHPNLVVVANKENVGYALANNHGVARSSGRNLILLNNDTLLEPGWLEPLLANLADPTIGLVGAKLIYPGVNTINHAGYVFSRALRSFYLLYEGQPPDFPAANTSRDLQAVLGACMAIRRSTFDQVGGVTHIGLEDIDLCFKVRRLGLRVRYCAESSLFHYGRTTLLNSAPGTIPPTTVHEFSQRWPLSSIEADDEKIYAEDGCRPFYTSSRAIVAFPDTLAVGGLLALSQRADAPAIDEAAVVEAARELVLRRFAIMDVVQGLLDYQRFSAVVTICLEWHRQEPGAIDPLLMAAKLLSALGRHEECRQVARQALGIEGLLPEQRLEFEQLLL